MAYTQTQLDALKKAYAQGVTSVEYDGKRVNYRSLQDMERIIAVMENEINGAIKPRFSLASFNRS